MSSGLLLALDSCRCLYSSNEYSEDIGTRLIVPCREVVLILQGIHLENLQGGAKSRQKTFWGGARTVGSIQF